MTQGIARAALPNAPDAPARRVLIIDDSVVARAVMGRMIDSMVPFEVVGAVSNVAAALAFLKQERADIILLDLELPGGHGLEAMHDLLVAGQGAKILVVSSTADDGAAVALRALALGATDTLAKPQVGNLAGRFAKLLEERMNRLFDRQDTVRSSTYPKPTPDDFDIVAVGASTGGIPALSQMLRAIPQQFEPPILVTQHLPASFMSYFAMQLALISGRPCDVAADRVRVRRGRILIAPGHAHIRCVRVNDGVAIRLSNARVANGCIPSVDPMLESVAEIYGARGLAVILSGMGRDGAMGAQLLVDAGGSVIVQDKASSVVWGMPGAIAASASAILPPSEIGRLVASGRRPG